MSFASLYTYGTRHGGASCVQISKRNRIDRHSCVVEWASCRLRVAPPAGTDGDGVDGSESGSASSTDVSDSDLSD